MKKLEELCASLAHFCTPGFVQFIAFTMPHECEFAAGHYGDYDHIRTERDPNDPGGTTRYGLDAASHPHVDIDALDFGAACAIYAADPWRVLRGDQLDPKLALALCDSANNCGQGRAVRWLQSAAGLEGADVDGAFGNQTLAAVLAADPAELVQIVIAKRLTYYRRDVRPALRERYLAGWENRVRDLALATR